MAKDKKEKSKSKSMSTLPFYAVLIVLFILFIYYQGKGEISEILGIALFMMIIIVIIAEVLIGIKETGAVRNIIEIVVAIVIVVAFWYGLKAFLHTNYPLDVVPSCSMLPNLQRGDLIVLHGVNNISQIKAPIIKINSSDYEILRHNIQPESLSCVAYNSTRTNILISQIIRPGYSIGLYEGDGIIASSQQGNPVQYACGSREIKFVNGTIENEAYTTSVTISGVTLYNDTNNSIIVYQTIPSDSFYQLGDTYIVHRVYAVLNYSGNYLMLTKGDNNPGLDLQYGNYPANMSFIGGKVVGTIPYLGYLKLALSNSFVEPSGCNSTVLGN
jgi:signal peptidase I